MTPKKARRTRALNEAISHLWQEMAAHDKDDFNREIVPVYTALLEQLKQHHGTDAAEQQLLDLLQNTANACRYRWTLRLPLKRPGSDYRKYEIVYTYALVTAMAVDCLQQANKNSASPIETAQRILPPEGIEKLMHDETLWQDWQGYFERAETGGLYAVAIGDRQWGKARPHKPKPESRHEQKEPQPGSAGEAAPGSGRAILAAIREGLEDGSLSFNHPNDAVHVDRQGRTFLEYPAALQWSKERLGLQEDLKRIKNRFDRLKLYKRSADGKQLFRGRLRQRDPRVRGYVFEDASVLWKELPPPGRFVIENLTTMT